MGLWLARSLHSLLHFATLHKELADKQEKIISLTSLGRFATKSTASKGLSSEDKRRSWRGCQKARNSSWFIQVYL